MRWMDVEAARVLKTARLVVAWALPQQLVDVPQPGRKCHNSWMMCLSLPGNAGLAPWMPVAAENMLRHSMHFVSEVAGSAQNMHEE